MAELTPRQKEIARLVRQGLTSQEIADRLGIRRRTVEAHRLNISQRQSGIALQQELEGLIKRVDAMAAKLARLQARRRRRP